MKFEKLVALFLSAYESEATKRGYRTAIYSWHEFIGSSLLRATEDDVRFFIEKRRKDPGQISRLPCRSPRVTAGTIKRQLTILSLFYKFLTKRKDAKVNPFEDIAEDFRAPTEPQKRPTRALQEEDFRRLLDGPDIRTKEGVRDRAILAVLFGCGLRRREAIHLTLSDFLISAQGKPFLRVCMGKGGKYREPSLPGWAAEALSLLIGQRKGEGARGPDPLFVWYYRDGRPKDRPMDAATFYRAFKGYLRLVGLPDSYSPHSARATAVTELKRKGIENRQIRQMTGHNSDQMVELYDKRENSVETDPGHLLDYGIKKKKRRA